MSEWKVYMIVEADNKSDALISAAERIDGTLDLNDCMYVEKIEKEN